MLLLLSALTQGHTGSWSQSSISVCIICSLHSDVPALVAWQVLWCWAGGGEGASGESHKQ
jgi:hypothetical protein